MNRFDELLGRVTMYRLVLYGLVALALMALLLMVVGNIEYDPLYFVLSVAVISASAYGSNRLLGWAFGVRPHSESALITGLILALLFIPPTDLIGLTKLALIAAIAMASKYVVAPRGRHIFNPAAIAIVIASVSGLGYAGWWVATPAMIPLTLLVGGLVLRRTKKQFISLAFVVAAVVSLFIQGTDPVTALLSWPILFVGAIMLSEPLTLPPRAKQQYIEAVVVGILMTVPFSYSLLTMTPALALVIGNLIGWWYGQRRAVRLRYVGKKQLTDTVYEFTFDIHELHHEPGQYIELTLPHGRADGRGTRRIFSIASRPGDEQLTIATKLPARPSSFKRQLMHLKAGDSVYATRTGGDFVLPGDETRQIVCIAGGIGITPFISFVQSIDRPMQLLYAVSGGNELAYAGLLKHHDVDVTVIAKDDVTLASHDWKYIKGLLNEEMLRSAIDIDVQPVVYVSGPPAMVASVRRTLKAIGVKDVRLDEFSGY